MYYLVFPVSRAHEIGQLDAARGCPESRLQYICLRYVCLYGVVFARGFEAKIAAFIRIKEAREDTGRIDPGKTKPVYRAVLTDMGGCNEISHHPVVFQSFIWLAPHPLPCHAVLFPFYFKDMQPRLRPTWPS